MGILGNSDSWGILTQEMKQEANAQQRDDDTGYTSSQGFLQRKSIVSGTLSVDADSASTEDIR